MKLLFATETFRNECNNQDQLLKRYGAQRARLIRQRLDELFNAEVLEDMQSLPHVALHGIQEGTDGMAVEVDASLLLAFRPESYRERAHSPGRDWKKVDSILILGLVKADGKIRQKPV